VRGQPNPVVGLRDRALIALMTVSFAVACGSRTISRRQALAAAPQRKRRQEIAGASQSRRLLDAYLHAAGLFEAKGLPSSTPPIWHGGALTRCRCTASMSGAGSAGRAEKAGIDAEMCCQTFRATGLTNFLANGGTLENAQAMADHASPRTTQLYDRTGDEVTLDEVERIAI
jgi:integrase/recombinase XerD